MIENLCIQIDPEYSAEHSPVADDGCILLYQKIFEQALRDLANRQNWKDAADWIFSDETGPTSFLTICKFLGLAHVEVRGKIRELLSKEIDFRKQVIRLGLMNDGQWRKKLTSRGFVSK